MTRGQISSLQSSTLVLLRSKYYGGYGSSFFPTESACAVTAVDFQNTLAQPSRLEAQQTAVAESPRCASIFT